MDDINRDSIRKKLYNSIDILDPLQHSSEGLVYIVTGKVITDPEVNVHKSDVSTKRRWKSLNYVCQKYITIQLGKQ